MNGRTITHIGSIVFGLACFLAGVATPTQAADDPDLQVTYLGNHGAVANTDVTFRVANAGNRPATSAFTARVTLNDNGKISTQDYLFDGEQPGESRDIHYRLPGGCFNVTLRVDVDVNNTIPEANEGNNSTGDQRECTWRGQPPIVFPTPTPGPRAATFAPTIMKTFGKQVRYWTDNRWWWPAPPDGVLVGYWNFYDDDFGLVVKDDYVYQGAFMFDLSQIHGVVTGARLTYVDAPVANGLRNGAGEPDAGGGPFPRTCANALGIPSVDWTNGYDGLLPNDNAFVGDGSRGGSWDVTSVIAHWVNYGNNKGFVLRGDNESFPDNDAACLSDVTTIRLVVTWLGQ